MDRDSLKTMFAVVAIPLVVIGGLGLAMNYEAPADTARKPEVIEAIIENSKQICDMSMEQNATTPYEVGLEEILSRVKTSTLDAIQKHNVTICLDQRLSQQETSFFSEKAYGVFYNQDAGARVLSLWDNGLGKKDDGFFTNTGLDYGPEAIRDLQGEELEGWFARQDPLAMLAHYSRSCGKNCTTSGYEWRDAHGFLSGFGKTMEMNPQLLTPPLKAPVMGLGS